MLHEAHGRSIGIQHAARTVRTTESSNPRSDRASAACIENCWPFRNHGSLRSWPVRVQLLTDCCASACRRSFPSALPKPPVSAKRTQTRPVHPYEPEAARSPASTACSMHASPHACESISLGRGDGRFPRLCAGALARGDAEKLLDLPSEHAPPLDHRGRASSRLITAAAGPRTRGGPSASSRRWRSRSAARARARRARSTPCAGRRGPPSCSACCRVAPRARELRS